MTKRLTTEEFIEKARKVHGDFYNYSKVNYKDSHSKIIISCPIHGDFKQTPNNHLNGQGCPKCSIIKLGSKRELTTEEFIEKARKVHGDFYDYSETSYKDYKTKVCIICPIHGKFFQLPGNHLKGHGCSKCSRNGILDKESFIERARIYHGNRYDYSKVVYKNSHTKVCITCPIHGDFLQKPNNHLKGHGCPKCGSEKLGDLYRGSIEDFLSRARKIHNDKYIYDKVVYKNAHEKVCIVCKEHGDFLQTPHNHLNGQGCPYCNSSKLEDQVRRLLLENNIIFEEQKTWDWLIYKSTQWVDFFLPDFNLIIECQGEQHFKAIDFFGGEEGYKNTIERDKNKKNLCEAHNLKVIYFSNLGEDYEYPYEVITNIEEFIKGLVL